MRKQIQPSTHFSLLNPLAKILVTWAAGAPLVSSSIPEVTLDQLTKQGAAVGFVREIRLLNAGSVRASHVFLAENLSWYHGVWSLVSVGTPNMGKCNTTGFSGEVIGLWNVMWGKTKTKNSYITWILFQFSFLAFCILFLVGWTEKVAECLLWLVVVH